MLCCKFFVVEYFEMLSIVTKMCVCLFTSKVRVSVKSN